MARKARVIGNEPPGLILSVQSPNTPGAIVSKLKLANQLAKDVASRFEGDYDGNGVGLGKIDEFIYFRTKSRALVAGKGISKIVNGNPVYERLLPIEFVVVDSKTYDPTKPASFRGKSRNPGGVIRKEK